MKPWENGALRVSNNGRYLMTGDKPFFWLGDTAWLMFAQLTEEEAYTYLRNRKEKGYNVIQATLVHQWPQQNIDGANALIDEDFTKPDLAGGFWDRVFNMIDIAEKLGLYMAILPTWGGNVGRGYLNKDNCDVYLDFLLSHLKDKPNIIWLVGGDVKGEAAYDSFCAIGNKLKKDGNGQLVGFHPFGRTSSSIWFHKEPWLDFNVFQSGHRRYDQVTMAAWDDRGDNMAADNTDGYGEDNWKYVDHDYSLSPKKPTIDGEPSYEQIPQGLHDKTQPYWQSWDVRRYAYWSCFEGAFGHTYGDNSIIQFYDDSKGVEGAFAPIQHWKVAMNNIGSCCMTHLKELMESVDFINGAARTDLLATKQGERYDRISVFAGPDFILCYDYLGNPFSLNLSTYPNELDYYWMDPITGVRQYTGRCNNSETSLFIPPEKLEGHNDWVLIIQPARQ